MSIESRSDADSTWSLSLEPRGWQVAALQRWEEQMKGIVRIVTGGGKTIFAQLCMTRFREKHPNGRVIIVVPTTSLLDQWVVSLAEDLRVNMNEIACYSGTEKPKAPRSVNVVVINTARTKNKQLVTDLPTMLIVDECHRAGSTQNALALQGCYTATLGLSATPEREYDSGFQDHIAPALGEIIYEYGYVEAARDHVISPFALHNVSIAMLEEEERRINSFTRRIMVERKRVQKGESPDNKLARLLQQRGALVANVTMRIPAAIKLAEQHLGKRTIIFHERVDAANHIKSILEKRNRSVTIYHAGIAPAVRRDNLRLYRRGVYDILVCCRALDEGINVPETAVAVLASSTASMRQRIQRLGRVLRPAKGKELADVYTIYATEAERDRLLKESQELGEVCTVSWAKIK